MPVFQYSAINKEGRNISGTMPAADESGLDQKLRDAGLWLTEAKVHVQKDALSKASTSMSRVRQYKLSGGRGRRELIEFCTLMTFQLKAGVTVIRALDVGAADCKSPQFREVLYDIQRQIEAGMTLNETLGLYPKIFTIHFVSVIRSGELSAKLPEAFEDLRAYLDWVDQMVGQVRQATIYPAIVSFVILCFTIFLFTYIVPKFSLLLGAFKTEPPLLTRIVFGVGDVFAEFWWLSLLLLLILFVGIPVAKRTSPGFLLMWDGWKLNYPIFGELNLMLALSRFMHNFSILYRSGLPIIQVFKACQTGLIGNKVIEKAVTQVGEEVAAGSTITEAMHRQPVFPALLIRMIAVGESSGNLDKALDNVTEYYNVVIPRRIKAVFAVAEPLLMLFLIFLVGCVALAIYLPIISLMDILNKQA